MAGYFDNWGYRYKEPVGKGEVNKIVKEYEVYGYARVYTRALGRTYSKSKTFFLGYLYGWWGTRSTTSYNMVRLVSASGNSQELFAISEAPLGGDKETLG